MAETAVGRTHGLWPELTGVWNDARGRFFYQARTASTSLTQTSNDTALFGTTITFGDGTFGLKVPTGAKVLVPNIVIEDRSSWTTYTDGTIARKASFTMSGGGKFIASWCNFSNSYINGAQAQQLTLNNCALSIAPDISECYDLSIDNVGIGPGITWPFYSSGWTDTSQVQGSNTKTWSQITGAVINKLYYCIRLQQAVGNNSGNLTPNLNINFSDNVTLTNSCFYVMWRHRQNCYALRFSFSNNCVLNNNDIFGGGLVFVTSSNNTVTNTRYSAAIGNFGATNNTRTSIMYDPATGERLVNNTPYYVKVLTQATSHVFGYDADQKGFTLNPRVYSATPYLEPVNHPYWFSATPTNNAVVLKWPRREPAPTSGTRYEIYRSTTSGSLGSIITGGTISTLQATAVSNTDIYMELVNDTTAVNGTTYYYTLRKYDSPGVFTDSAQQIATPAAITATQNICLYSQDFSNAAWTKNTVTVTTNVDRAPAGAIWSSGTGDADQLAPTSANSSVTQVITATAGQTYTFSVYMRLGAVTTANPSTALNLEITDNATVPLTTTQSCTVERGWRRYWVTHTVGTGGTNITVRIGGSSTWATGETIVAADAQVVVGSSPGPVVGVTSASAVTETLLDLSTSVTTGSTANEGGIAAVSLSQGTEIITTFGSTEAGKGAQPWREIHLGTSPGFTPSLRTLVWHNFYSANVAEVGANAIRFTGGSNSNVVNTFTSYGRCGTNEYFFYLDSSSNNQFINCTFNAAGGLTRCVQVLNTATANSNFFHDIEFNGLPQYPRRNNATYTLFDTTNNSGGYTLQNVRSNTGYTYPHATNWLNTAYKGVFGSLTLPLMNTTSVLLDPSTANTVTIDNNYTTVYDYIFNELYESSTTGNLTILCNASSKASPPYSILAGSPTFLNNGQLLFGTAGDSIEWTWPNRILGVSGFRSVELGSPTGASVYLGGGPSSAPLGDATGSDGVKRLGAINIEYSLDTGSGYGAYKRLNNTNLLGETVSATAGFGLKIRMTAMRTIPFTGQTSAFVLGETINGQTSGATAVIDEIVDNGTTGHLWVSSVTGNWGASENIRSGVTVRAVTVASPNQILPIQNQAVNNTLVSALRIFTNVDQTAKYFAVVETLTLTGVIPGTEIHVYRESDEVELGGTESLVGSTFTLDYGWASDFDVFITLIKPGYKWLRIDNQTLTASGLTIPVFQTVDRDYNNPP
jgi:hypothetical protein